MSTTSTTSSRRQTLTQAGGEPGAPKGLSIWWLIIPTLIYIWIDRNIVGTVAVIGLAAILRFVQGRLEVPQAARALLPLAQSAAVFVLIGGNFVIVAITAAFGFIVARYHEGVVSTLAPWWRIQQTVPTVVRFALGFIVTLGIGYFFGGVARGNEWSVTLVSITIASVVMFLFTFNPPNAVPRRAASLRTGR